MPINKTKNSKGCGDSILDHLSNKSRVHLFENERRNHTVVDQPGLSYDAAFRLHHRKLSYQTRIQPIVSHRISPDSYL